MELDTDMKGVNDRHLEHERFPCCNATTKLSEDSPTLAEWEGDAPDALWGHTPVLKTGQP